MVKVGQRWKENDGRFNRTVSIVDVDSKRGKAAIRTIDRYYGTVSGRKSWASIERFNGKSNGYTLIQEAK
jgi:hypothetical protein